MTYIYVPMCIKQCFRCRSAVYTCMCVPIVLSFGIDDNRAPDEDSHFKVEYREALTSIVFGSALPVLAVVGFILLSVAIGWKVRQKRSRKGRRKQMLRSVQVVPQSTSECMFVFLLMLYID